MCIFVLRCPGVAQELDTMLKQEINPITIKGFILHSFDVKQMESMHSGYVTSGKKNEVIIVQDLPANIAEKTGRQIFAKIPGAFIYDMDGSGNQINISTRGLDPHRSWEYNVRQNGVLTNSDMYGYPASHYSPPMEAIQKIELLRGAASLQYGSQFGGMINYITKQPDTSKTLGMEMIQSIGSFGLFSSYVSIGGKKGKWTYQAYYQKRRSEGYRKNAQSDAEAQFVSVRYNFSSHLSIRAEMGRSLYKYQVPGPLTDAMFLADPRQSTRGRNFFNPDIYLPSMTLDWKMNKNMLLKWTTSAVLGHRSSVQFIGFADARDTILTDTHQYAPRQVDIDNFNSYTSDLKWQYNYKIGILNNTVVAGLCYINNDLHRRQLEKGSTGTDFDLTVHGQFGRDLHLKSQNIALFIENLFRISEKLEVSLGFRVENGKSSMSGIISYIDPDNVPQNIPYSFSLFGGSLQYLFNKTNKIYGGWSQAYRPLIFSDLIPGNILEKNDPSIQNAFGHNMEAGIKGVLFQNLTYDVNYFRILYKNRIGSQVLTDSTGNSFIWKTNIGNSITHGVEMYLDYVVSNGDFHKLSVFSASSYFKGYYTKGVIRNGSENVDISNNTLEGVPTWISRNGIQFSFKNFSSIFQYSYVSESFSDVFNTLIPNSNGTRGIVPSYGIFDVNMSFRILRNVLFRFGVNNLTNVQYFTKRPVGYPGAGIWSSDGRSIVATIGIKI